MAILENQKERHGLAVSPQYNCSLAWDGKYGIMMQNQLVQLKVQYKTETSSDNHPTIF